LKGHGFTCNGKRLYFAKNPEVRPSVAKANADLIDLIGTAKAMPLRNQWQNRVFPQPVKPCPFKTEGKIEFFPSLFSRAARQPFIDWALASEG